MKGEWLALAFALGVPFGLRILDYLMPKGHHFRFVSRYSEVNEDDADGEGDSSVSE